MPILDDLFENEEATKPCRKPPPKDFADMTLFDHLVQINAFHDEQIGPPEQIVSVAKAHADIACEKLEITPLQAVLFADMLCAYDGDAVSLRELARIFQCKPVEVFRYIDEFIVLERKGLIVYRHESRHYPFHDDGLAIEIPWETLIAIQKGNRPENLWTEKLSADEFMNRAGRLCEEQMQHSENYNQTLKKFELLKENNLHVGFVKMLESYGLRKDDELLLLYFCVNYICDEEDEMEMHAMESFRQTRSDFRSARMELRAGKHILQQKGLIDHANHGGFAQREIFCLTNKAKDELLGDYTDLLGKKSIHDLIDPTSIVEKTLFYPEKTTKDVREFSKLLREENWHQVRQNLKQNAMRTGFACLFSGAPGTGKTETAKQIARTTGRGIIEVDISETKSMWFGESEKRIKAVFNRYRAAVKVCDVTPILLFNEADAVIGKRQELGDRKNGPGQTENAIQNIILQEIENLDGILIATTNLTYNMDKAFERRFLYKIDFEKPTLETRKSIWTTLIPELPKNEVDVLAERFDFSGGQIENISRRRTVALVLHGKAPGLDDMIGFCDAESSDDAKRIGFER